MDFQGNGVTTSVNPAELSDAQLIAATREFALEAMERGLEIPALAGTVAVRDSAELKTNSIDANEAITGQLDTSYKGYQSVVEQLNKNRDESEKIEAGDEETLKTEFESWFSEKRQAYVAEAMEADSELSFDLLVVANETVTVDEILEDGRDFGEDQPYRSSVYPEVISQYTPEEVSGTNPENGNKFKFVLVPSKFTPELYGTVAAQKQALAELQKDAPFLEAPVPLTDMTFRHTRRANGDKLVGPGTEDATYMRSYDMEPKPVDRYLCVPYSVVAGSGGLVVYRSVVEVGSDGRALVG